MHVRQYLSFLTFYDDMSVYNHLIGCTYLWISFRHRTLFYFMFFYDVFIRLYRFIFINLWHIKSFVRFIIDSDSTLLFNLSIRGLINLLLRTFDPMFHKEVRIYLVFPSKQFLAQSKLAWLFPFECYQITLYNILWCWMKS